MIRDGLDEQPIVPCRHRCRACPRPLGCGAAIRDADLRAQGWRPISTAPLAVLDVVIRASGSVFASGPNWIKGLTTHNNVVEARYLADGSYRDRWTNARGNVTYNLTHWRPIRRS